MGGDRNQKTIQYNLIWNSLYRIFVLKYWERNIHTQRGTPTFPPGREVHRVYERAPCRTLPRYQQKKILSIEKESLPNWYYYRASQSKLIWSWTAWDGKIKPEHVWLPRLLGWWPTTFTQQLEAGMNSTLIRTLKSVRTPQYRLMRTIHTAAR